MHKRDADRLCGGHKRAYAWRGVGDSALLWRKKPGQGAGRSLRRKRPAKWRYVKNVHLSRSLAHFDAGGLLFYHSQLTRKFSCSNVVRGQSVSPVVTAFTLTVMFLTRNVRQIQF
jgi:hypothetical protein